MSQNQTNNQVGCCHDTRLTKIFSDGAGYGIEHIVRWCESCGAVVIDSESDGRLYSGRVMAMRVPRGPVKSDAENGKKQFFRCMSKNDHNGAYLTSIYSVDVGYHIEHVVRWCEECGCIVIDGEFDGRVAPGRVMKMLFPTIIKREF